MAVNVSRMLRRALTELERERARIEGQIVAIRHVLSADHASRQAGAARVETRPKPRRKVMSGAARKAVSQRMKAYWAKRRAKKVKAGGKK